MDNENFNIEKNTTKKDILDPLLDPVFQTLFNNERKENTENLVSCILGQRIKIKKIENEYSLTRSSNTEKVGRLDLYAETYDETSFIIELQLENKFNMAQRLIFSNCAKISKQLKRGNDFKKLTPVISIGILNYELPELKGLNIFQAEAALIFSGIKPETRLTNLQRYFIIDLTKVKKLYDKGSNDPLLNWGMYLKDPKSKEVKKIMDKDPEIKKLNNDLEELSQDEQLQREAEFWRMNKINLEWDRASIEEHYMEVRHGEAEKKSAKKLARKTKPLKLLKN